MRIGKHTFYILVSICFCLISINGCKDEPSFFKGLNVVNITTENGQQVMVNTNLETNEVTSFVLPKTVGIKLMFDELTESVGYVSRDSTFYLVNPLTGNVLITFPISHQFRQGAIDSERRTFSYIYQTTNSLYDLRIATHSLENGELLADSNIQGDRSFAQGLEMINVRDNRYYTQGTFLYGINTLTGELEIALDIDGPGSQYGYLDSERKQILYFGERFLNNGDNTLRIYDLTNGSEVANHTVVIPYETISWGWPIYGCYLTKLGDKFLIDNRRGSTFYIDTSNGDLLLEQKHSRKGNIMLYWEHN